jgi:hypothetical protein
MLDISRRLNEQLRILAREMTTRYRALRSLSLLV